jgi:uncharacterized protein YggE
MGLRFFALAALAAGQATLSAAQPVIQAVPERPRIVVDGYGEVKTPPDLAIIGYTVRGEGATSDDAVRALTATGSRIEAALRKVDRAAEPQTGDVRVTPVKSDACKEEEYSAPQLSSGPCAVLGYVATQTMTVRTAAVADAGTMVGLIGRGGGFNTRISSFELRDPRVAQGQAMAAALSDAASKASAIAAASRVPLGGILSINTAARQAGEQLIVTGLRRPAAEMDSAEFAAPPPVPVRVNPEPIATSSNVTVTYAIGH